MSLLRKMKKDLLKINAPTREKQVCRALQTIFHDMEVGLTDKEAFNLSREKLVEKYSDDGKLPTGDKHNSLFDAKVIKILYETFK